MHAGVARGKRLNPRRKIGPADAGKGPQANLAVLHLRKLFLPALKPRLCRRNLLQKRKIAFSVARQLQPVRLAADQRRSQLLFERFDRLADGALRIIELVCRLREAAKLDHRAEHAVF